MQGCIVLQLDGLYPTAYQQLLSFSLQCLLTKDISPLCFNIFTSLNSWSTIDMWDVSKITDMSSLFTFRSTCNPSIGGWDVSHCTNFVSSLNVWVWCIHVWCTVCLYGYYTHCDFIVCHWLQFSLVCSSKRPFLTKILESGMCQRAVTL